MVVDIAFDEIILTTEPLMRMDYRDTARHALARAKTELASGDPDRLVYAALEIRKAMEAVTYGRAKSYEDEIPKVQYRTWQPRKIVEYLTKIDPKAVIGSSVAVGLRGIVAVQQR